MEKIKPLHRYPRSEAVDGSCALSEAPAPAYKVAPGVVERFLDGGSRALERFIDEYGGLCERIRELRRRKRTLRTFLGHLFKACRRSDLRTTRFSIRRLDKLDVHFDENAVRTLLGEADMLDRALTLDPIKVRRLMEDTGVDWQVRARLRLAMRSAPGRTTYVCKRISSSPARLLEVWS